MQRKILSLFILPFLFLFLVSLEGKENHKEKRRVIRLESGQSIQRAINQARKSHHAVTIKLAEGKYRGNFVVTGTADELDTTSLEIVGDAREFVGTSFVSGGFANPSNIPFMGASNLLPVTPDLIGETTLVSNGNTLAIQIQGGGLDLIRAGLQKGDHIILSDPQGNITEPRKVIDFSATTVSFDGSPLNFSEDGSTVTFLPNRTLIAESPALHAFIFKRAATLRGFYIKTPKSGLVDNLLYTEHNLVRLRSCVMHDSSQQSILVNAERGGVFAAGDNFAFLIPQAINQGIFQLNQAIVNENATVYPLTFIGGSIGAYIDAISELTASALVAFGQKSSSVFGDCESHLRLANAQFAHVGAVAAVAVGLNAFAGLTYAQVINNPGLPQGLGILVFERGSVFASNMLFKNVGLGFANTSGSFVDQSAATYENVPVPIADSGFSNHL